MKKIAVINDLSGMGKCSLTAAIPVISVMGVQACPLPTAILSNQTGYPSYYCEDYTEKMDYFMDEWEKMNFLPDGIYSGFLADAGQIDKVLEFIRRFAKEKTLILVDPVLGDQGETYGIYTEKLGKRMRELAACAQILTPNLTEAMILLEDEEHMLKEWKKLHQLPEDGFLAEVEKIGKRLYETYPKAISVITGIDCRKDGISQMGNLICREGGYRWVLAPKYGASYSGTGDLFASILCAGMVRGWSVEVCVNKAVNFLGKAIYDTVQENTDRNDGVCFEKYLYELGA